MKKEIAILFGGISSEHEISIVSSRSVAEHLSPDEYHIHYIGINAQGQMMAIEKEQFKNLKKVPEKGSIVHFIAQGEKKGYLKGEIFSPVDVVFPVLHGTGGEDGWMQGFFDTLQLPYVGSNVEGSCICMNKSIAKKMITNTSIQQVPFSCFFAHEDLMTIKKNILEKFTLPVFIKPSHGGSSIGISKCKTEETLISCIELAFQYDREIIVEQAIQGREIECSVLGDYENIRSSLPGEIIPLREFYDFDAKYVEQSTRLEIPANLSDSLVKKLQEKACEIFLQLRCYGMARIDFFVQEEKEEIYLNEVNTIPGFTAISMYPKLWEISGLSYCTLLDELIRLAVLRRLKYKYG